MRTECPHCGQHYEVDKEYENQIVECISCGQEFVVEIQPEQGSAVAPPRTSSGARTNCLYPSSNASKQLL